MKHTLALLAIIIFFIGYSVAQTNGGGMPEFTLTGKVMDAGNSKPIPYVTVYLKHLKDSTYFSGGLANDSGSFNIEQLRPGPYEVKISFIGYKTYIDTIALRPPDLKKDLGTILLSPESNDLKEFNFSEDKPDFTLGIDRKIFNVDKNNIASGGSALDVLKQVPTITVDVDGSITLRGTGSFVIFINGKTSGLTVDNRSQILQQIPANNIDRIEIITNPSAKFDAEGMTGIINIITKKQLADGKSGTIQVGIGTGNKYNVSGSFNMRVKNFSMSHTIGFRYNQYWNEGWSTRTNTPDSLAPNSINQTNFGNRNSISPTISGNFDWVLKKDASISVNYLFNYGNNSNPDSLKYNYLDSAGWLTRETYRITKAIENSYNTSVGFNFNKKFKKDRELSASTNINYNASDETDNYHQQEYTLYHSVDTNYNPFIQNNYKNNTSIVSTTQLDYVHPFKEKFKFETGFKVTIRDINNTLIADSFDNSLGRLIVDSTITNKFHYFENVNAVYGTFQAMFKKWGFQAGLRIEQTNIMGNQQSGNVNFTKNYINLFPSAFITYKISDVHTLQLAYSRRINRPGLGQLNPFAQYDDPLNLRIGNPDLNPENIDAVELNYNMNLYTKKKMSHNLIVTGYFRIVHGVIQRYRYITGDISTVTFLNLDESINFGGEIVLRNGWFKWWNMTTNFNMYRNQVIGNSPVGNLQATNFSYSIRSQQTFKMAKIAELQLSLNYMAPQTFPQGQMKEMWNVDAAIKFDLFKGRASVTFNITDIFNTRRFAIYSYDSFFFSDNYRKRESRIFTFQFIWKFGDINGQTNKKKPNNNSNQGGGDPDMGGL
jgi:iron complex outermembrane receptor protein